MTALQRLGLHPPSLAQGPLDTTDPLSSDPATSRRQHVAGVDLSAGQGTCRPDHRSATRHHAAATPGSAPDPGVAPSFTSARPSPRASEDRHDTISPPVVAAMPGRVGASPPGAPAHRPTGQDRR
jgi:hypothetical protein